MLNIIRLYSKKAKKLDKKLISAPKPPHVSLNKPKLLSTKTSLGKSSSAATATATSKSATSSSSTSSTSSTNSSPSASANSETTTTAATSTSTGSGILVNPATSEEQTIEKKPKTFIPISKFPKLPKEFESTSTNELYEQIYMKSIINNNLINFEIPKEYSKEFIKSQLTPKDKALIEQLDNFMTTNDENERMQNQINMMKLYYDKDSFNFKSVPEHSLKKSLSGMINLNPHLEDIDDEYLWELIPNDKLFGRPFFEKKDNNEKNFKNWEISMINKNEKLINEIKLDNDEINNFISKFNSNNKSFYNKVNGRYKLNRKLYKEYKNLKEKGKLIILKGEKSIDFDIEFENQNTDLKLKK